MSPAEVEIIPSGVKDTVQPYKRKTFEPAHKAHLVVACNADDSEVYVYFRDTSFTLEKNGSSHYPTATIQLQKSEVANIYGRVGQRLAVIKHVPNKETT